MKKTQYSEFLVRKAQAGARTGFKPIWMSDALFDFQAVLAEWSIEQGRAGVFADCGLGKTLIQLTWAENVVRHTNKPVLVLTPLAVGPQTVAEAAKFDIGAHHITGRDVRPGINTINYERLHHLDWQDFGGVVCDESSILKNMDGVRRADITVFMRKVPYRLLCTATAAPNDYMELGTSSEALGYLGYTDMLHRFFKNDRSNVSTGRYHGQSVNWRLKHHAEKAFWRWVCSWARACRRPSDLGCDDGPFVLPPLIETEHLVEVQSRPSGMLFQMPARDLDAQREERRRTLPERCERVASLVDTGKPALVWCHLNTEGDLLERLIPDAYQVSGDDSEAVKEERLLAFANGEIRVLVTKPKIGAWGLNFQRCAHVTFFPSHSFEQYYQGVRRCWRFGQTQAVQVDVVTTEGERGVIENLQRKAKAADAMFASLVTEMGAAMSVDAGWRTGGQDVEVPAWVS